MKRSGVRLMVATLLLLLPHACGQRPGDGGGGNSGTDCDCSGSLPNCDPDTGECQASCPGTACPAALPNCDSDGLCVAPCTTATDCTNPTSPNCDPDTGLCQGECPEIPCPPDVPNCDTDGGCFADCADHDDCVNPAQPNCVAATGVCQGECPAIDCPPPLPNCGAGGLCIADCSTNFDCTNINFPNCDSATSLCQGQCPMVDCPDYQPNCTASGLCFPPCGDDPDCLNLAEPNCDTATGLCFLAGCSDDDDCLNPAAPICDTATGLCYFDGCLDDSDCSPPTTVCEDTQCVPGCTMHSDCDPADRCDLITPGHLFHCEPRDCIWDSDCPPALPVCDTDGLMDPEGGGYCTTGCDTFYDCPIGYDCDPATHACTVRDYGDIGQDCAAGCHSGFCLVDEGNVCTGFCCIQHDCPPGWGCRTHDDGTGGDRTLDVCVPLPMTQGEGRYSDGCNFDEDCRSDICTGAECLETCCTDGDCDQPFVSNVYCSPGSSIQRSNCTPKDSGDDPVGTLGCTTGTADCSSALCLTLFYADIGCTNDDGCPTLRPTCYDLAYGNLSSNECVHDHCSGHCCSADDCPDAAGYRYACGKAVLPSGGDYNLCMLHESAGTKGEAEACASDDECRSGFCSDTANVCRRRCCTDADCTSAPNLRCGLEQAVVYVGTRWLNFCLP